MKFYKIECLDGIDYKKLYNTLESIGDFVIDGTVILFYDKNLRKINTSNLNIKVEEIDATKYKSGNKMSDDWIMENYRKFKVEDLLRKAEIEKQEEIQSLYKVIRAASDIIDRKEDLIEQE